MPTMLTALLLCLPLADRSEPVSLAHVESVFAGIDGDQDGYLDRQETARVRVPVGDHARFDADLDAHLNEAEFVLYYHHLLREAGRRIDRDLGREATRLRAGQRAREVERERSSAKRVRALFQGGVISRDDALEWATALWAPFDGRHPVPRWRHERAVASVRAQLVDLRHEGAVTPDEVHEVERWLTFRDHQRRTHHAS